jgi:hypothetical protein
VGALRRVRSHHGRGRPGSRHRYVGVRPRRRRCGGRGGGRARASRTVARALPGYRRNKRTSLNNNVLSRLLDPLRHRSRPSADEKALQRPWSARVWWAREELNLRPLPCPQNPGNRSGLLPHRRNRPHHASDEEPPKPRNFGLARKSGASPSRRHVRFIAHPRGARPPDPPPRGETRPRPRRQRAS